jgi:hypothetical protein
VIFRSFRRGINFWNWDDIENLPDKAESRGSKDKAKQLSKHRWDQRLLDKNQWNAVQTSGVRSGSRSKIFKNSPDRQKNPIVILPKQ